MANVYALLNSGDRIGLNAGGAVLLNAVDADAVTPDSPITYGGGDHDYDMRVRNWWAEIDRLRSKRLAKEEAERERHAAAERQRQALAELEAERSKRKRKAAQQARAAEIQRVRDEIEESERQADELRREIEIVTSEIARIHAEIEVAEQYRAVMALRRRRMVALLLIASQ